MKRVSIYITGILLSGWMMISTSCEKAMEGEIYQVYDEKMIDEVMEENNLSDFLSIVEKGELRGTIHAYGKYTLFAPTNEAVKSYLQQIEKSGVEALSKEEAEAIVKYHLVRVTGSDTTLLTTDFVDGRLPYPNFLRKYLTTKTEAEGSDVFIRVNRQAKIITKDLRASNGYVQIIDNVLTPPVQTVADRIAELPDAEYSLIKTVFNLSGLADSLSVEKTDYWFTFFIQNNEAYQEAGINHIEDLLAQLRESRPEIEDDTQLIQDYVSYHCINNLMYIADLMVVSSLQTLVPKQVITFKRNLDVILLNEFEQGQTTEPGVLLDRASDYSDWSCSNGVIHKINGNIQIKNRTAYRIYWDLAEQPEMMALKSFRKAGANVPFASGELANITWGGKTAESVYYYCSGYPTVLDPKSQYVYADYIHFRMSSNTMLWLEMKTPVLLPGKYKVWLCYRRLHEVTLKTTFKQDGYDDQILPYTFDLSAYMPSPEAEGSSHELIELDGWKQYNAKKFESVMISHLLGTIVVETTGQHTLRFDVLGTSPHTQDGNWDMIQFIPVDEDQLWPRVDIKGNWIGPETPVCEIFPRDCTDEVE
ncbi:MAG: fasciclin domain-containing protein [Dysgonamonadaceae bacterium]|jgi:uncharacterized surface protein with fasciclin (FAS1) repeats|nr:fasciclin domain-containing protein [Dysgonamonadaceae bacterium]